MIFKKLKTLRNDNSYNVEECKLSKVLLNIILPYLNEVSKIGIKTKINQFLPRVDLDKFIIARIRSELFGSKNINFGRRFGGLNARYGIREVNIRFIGIAGWLIRNIVITDDQIISCIDDIFDQINNRYLKDTTYVENKVKEICKELSNKVIYEDKTLYNFLLEILEGSHIRGDEEVPAWVKNVIESFGESKLTEDILYFLIENISEMISELTEGIYFNLKLTFDSWFLRFVLKRKTNNGQLSELMEAFGISIDSIKNFIINDYMSPSFTKGMGSLAKDLAVSLLYDIAQYDTPNNKVSELIEPVCISKPFQVTMTFGKDPLSSRAFRWYCAEGVSLGCVRISKDKKFLNYIDVDALKEKKVKLKTTFHWGISSNYDTYTVSRFSCEVNNLKRGTKYWYKVGSKEMDIWSEVGEIYIPDDKNSFTFVNLLDSQGLVREDYDIFCKAAEASINNTREEVAFVAHLGDFVNDGNNEDYWDWVLNNKCFRNNAILPVTGNHETRVNSLVQSSNIDNAILSHFNICNAPEQDLATGCYYSFEYMNTTFIILNTGDFDKYGYLSDKQFDWVVKTAKAAKTKWKVILSHKSPYSNGPHHNDYDVKAMSSQIKELASKCDIDLLIAGHDHVYSRTPIMRYSNKTKYKEKETIHNGIKYRTAINPLGTLFLVPGTSGVKNYRQDLSIIYPSEVLLQFDKPIYSTVEITDTHIFFTAYKYDLNEDKSEIIDNYAIEKTNVEDTVEEVKKEIESLPDCYLYQEESKVNRVEYLYNKLSYKEKIRVRNYGKLIESKKAIDSVDEISNGRIAIVRNKSQFDKAIHDKDISTIVTDCQTINFSNCLGGYSKYNIDRCICIRGNSRLTNVIFNIKKDSLLIIDDNVMIDNTRQKWSLFSAINCINIFDNGILILNDYASLRTEYGLGCNGICVLLIGASARAYFNSRGELYGGKGSVASLNDNSKIVINNGKFLSDNKHYAVKSSGSIEINDGKIKNICTYKNSNMFMNGGSIGSDEGTNKSTCDLDGNVYITGCNLNSNKNKNDKEIILARSNANINISPDHKYAVKIGNIYPFININNDENKVYHANYKPDDLKNLSELENNRYGKYAYSKMSYTDVDNRLEKYINCFAGGKIYIYSKL